MQPSEARRRPDLWILGVAAALTCLGVVLVYSTSSPLTFGKVNGDAYGYLKRAVVYALLGLAACTGALRVPPETVRKLAYPGIAAAALLLCLPLVPSLGAGVNGAHRWVRFPGFGFQPSEVAKLAVVLFLAHSLAKRGDRVKSFAYGFLPNMLIPAVPLALILVEPDLGTTVLLAAVVGAMALAGGVRLKHLSLAVAPALVLVVGLVAFVPWRLQRVLAFLDPWSHARGAGFQLVQSLLAFGNGGFWGVGLGAGRQKLYYLPEAHTDFILSVWAEEGGLVGVWGVLAAMAFLVVRGYRIALRQEDAFRRLLATGLTTWIGLQAGLNALVVTGCLPTKGLPFPFLSYGGTGLIISLTAAGLLSGLAREAVP
ncbi:MAG: putative lipid II flippase FtsW [Deltaproteobacteria bacterium]|nr:putative lipid II flippase FtsW [Deltaproteobacteria bacterium]